MHVIYDTAIAPPTKAGPQQKGVSWDFMGCSVLFSIRNFSSGCETGEIAVSAYSLMIHNNVAKMGGEEWARDIVPPNAE